MSQFNPSDADYDNLEMQADDYDELMRARDMADEEDGVHWSQFEDDYGDDDDNVVARWYDMTGEWELVDDAHYPGM